MFASGVVQPPAQAHVGEGAFRALGADALLAAGYVAACAKAQGRQLARARAAAELPRRGWRWCTGRVGDQLGLMASAMYLLLGGKVPYGITLGVMLAASIAGVVTPIPAGLGVLEAVYLALLSGRCARAR